MTGIFVGCDLDVDAKNVSSTIIKKKVGNIAVWVWDLFWYQYRRSFKHGSFGSHFPLFGTFVRLAYVYFLTILPFYGFYFLMLHSHYYQDWLMNELYYWVAVLFNPWFFYGLASSDTVHYFLDILTTNSE